MNSLLNALRVPLTVLIMVVVGGGGLLYYTDLALKRARVDLSQQQSQLRDARMRLQKSGDEKDLIVRYLDGYRYLQKLGFVGDEQRINWLDGLRLANQRTQLFGVDYEIATQQPYPLAPELDPGQLSLYQSVMKVRLSLLHEGDLMRFLGALAQQNVGVFSVNECVVQRLDTIGIRVQPHLRAECQLAWITIQPTPPTAKKS